MNYQDTIDRIIKEEILTLANTTVEILQKVDETWFEDCDNLNEPVCTTCGAPLKDDDIDAYTCPQCDADFEASEVDYEPKEVMQWFIVTDWLADKLRAQGEAVWAPHDIAFWGRCGCGYSLTEEDCLKNIARVLTSRMPEDPVHIPEVLMQHPWCDTDTG